MSAIQISRNSFGQEPFLRQRASRALSSASSRNFSLADNLIISSYAHPGRGWEGIGPCLDFDILSARVPIVAPKDEQSSDPYGSRNLRWKIRSPLLVHPDEGARVAQLVDQWLEDTKYTSSFHEIMGHPAYDELKTIGKPSLRFALSRLKSGDLQVHWFLLAREISGVDPVPYKSRGKLREMARHWLKWAKREFPYG